MKISISIIKGALPVDVHVKVANQKTVKVRSYTRTRKGKFEKVKSHYRKV